MTLEVFYGLPQQAMDVRQKVFVEEQGFRDEFDQVDETAAHFVLFDGSNPVGVCRVFPSQEDKVYLLGRLAVLKSYRGQNCGGRLMAYAEEYVRNLGGTQMRLHAQCRAEAFYAKQGYTAFGEVEYEEDCPHIWMYKNI